MLTVDIGNTSVKWAVWGENEIIEAGSCTYSKQAAQEAFASWRDLRPEPSVIAACVAGDVVEKALTAWMQRNWSLTPVFLRSTAKLGNVSNGYADPSEYGADRWAALLGAHTLYAEPVCIIDAGTAITVDLMDVGGRHRGGLILPGLQMMRDALLQGAAGIHQTSGGITDFADNTADAVSSGTLHMVRAAITDIASSAARLLGSRMRIIITGGSAGSVLSLPGMPAMQHEPALVLRGLHVAARLLAAGD